MKNLWVMVLVGVGLVACSPIGTNSTNNVSVQTGSPLEDIILSVGDLSPAFSSDIYEYYSIVNTNSISITAITHNSEDNVSISGAPVDRHSQEKITSLDLGTNDFEILSVSYNELYSNTYITHIILQDVIAPGISNNNPSNQNLWYKNKPSISVSLSDDIGLSKIELYYNNVLQSSQDISGVYTQISVSTAGLSLAQGENILVLKLTDAAGNTSTQNVLVKYDTVAPVIPNGTWSNNDYLVTLIESGSGIDSIPMVISTDGSGLSRSINYTTKQLRVYDARYFDNNTHNMVSKIKYISVRDIAGNMASVNY